ncbi:hypothetical protein CUJ88_47465 (plasmid) [Paraburkholderia hospita]|nr:hypothetical protein CUJ88_47465 [Paraburkholderia hospita]
MILGGLEMKWKRSRIQCTATLPKHDGHSELRTLTSEKSGSGVQLRDVASHFASALPSHSVAIIALGR